MANICLYKIKVRGTQQACYALVNMMPLYSWEKEYISEEGTKNDFTLVFSGACKWHVDAYTSALKNPVPFTKEELDNVEDGDHWDKNLKDKSTLLNCEVFCNSKDIDDSCYANYVHYNKGVEIYDECPKELHIKRGRDYDWGYSGPSSGSSNTTAVDTGKKCKVKFESGSYWYIGDQQVGDLVYVEGAKSGQIGKVVECTDSASAAAIYNVLSCVGHIDNFRESDIEKVWNSYKPAVRKEYLKKLGLDEKITKKKFASIMEYKWTLFGQKENDWNEFLKSLDV